MFRYIISPIHRYHVVYYMDMFIRLPLPIRIVEYRPDVIRNVYEMIRNYLLTIGYNNILEYGSLRQVYGYKGVAIIFRIKFGASEVEVKLLRDVRAYYDLITLERGHIPYNIIMFF